MQNQKDETKGKSTMFRFSVYFYLLFIDTHPFDQS